MSYASFPAEVVVAACERHLVEVTVYQKACEDASVARRIADSVPGVLARLLGAKPLSEEVARREYLASMECRLDRLDGPQGAAEARATLTLAKQAMAAGVSNVALSAQLALALEQSGAFSRD